MKKERKRAETTYTLKGWRKGWGGGLKGRVRGRGNQWGGRSLGVGGGLKGISIKIMVCIVQKLC